MVLGSLSLLVTPSLEMKQYYVLLKSAYLKRSNDTFICPYHSLLGFNLLGFAYSHVIGIIQPGCHSLRASFGVGIYMLTMLATITYSCCRILLTSDCQVADSILKSADINSGNR